MSTLNVNSIQTTGGASPVLTADIAKNSELIASSGSSLVGHIASGAGGVATTVQAVLRETVSATRFGVLASNNAAQNDAAFAVLRTYAIANAPLTIHIPKGTYQFTDMGNWAISGVTLRGDIGGTILECTSAVVGHTALLIHAFQSGSPTDPFAQQCNLENLTVEGNTNTTYLIRAIGLARSNWNNVNVREANTSSSVAFQFDGGSSNNFTNLSCSTDLAAMALIPHTGLKLVEGFRAGVSIGSVTNNVYTNCMFEGLTIGEHLVAADQCVFVGGTAESCTSIGLKQEAGSRFCTFINHAMEGNTNYDVFSSGIYCEYQNCYSLKSFVLDSNFNLVRGGFYERIEIQAGVKNVIENVRINHVGGGSGGFFDSGDATEWKNLYDGQLLALIYPFKARTAITMPAAPQVAHEYVNNTRQYIEVIIQTGTFTEIARVRDGSAAFLVSNITPCSHWLAPKESLLFTYAVSAPSVSYLPHNGFQG